jgi:hypothetical protein
MNHVAASSDQGPKYFVKIEGTEYEWPKSTISVVEIRTLGGLPADLPVVQEFLDGTERTLAETDTIELQPGHRFGRAPRYKRG